MKPRLEHGHVEQWITRCLQNNRLTLFKVESLKNVAEREVWACQIEQDKKPYSVVAIIFKPGSTDNVNSSLPPVDTARKCAFAMQEVSRFGIPTPRCLGFAVQDQTAAIVTEKVERTAWSSDIRVKAACYLARLHVENIQRLSQELCQLVQRSNPKQQRTYSGLFGRFQTLDMNHPEWRSKYPDVVNEVESLLRSGPPITQDRSLVHGDYFSVNIIPTHKGVCIIDWETFALGDPMWDLAFLIGADRNLKVEEVEAVIGEYGKIAPIEINRLMWHKRRWDAMWQLRDIGKHFQEEKSKSL